MSIDSLINKIDEVINKLDAEDYRSAQASMDKLEDEFNAISQNQEQTVKRARSHQASEDASVSYIKRSMNVSHEFSDIELKRNFFLPSIGEAVDRPALVNVSDLKQVADMMKSTERNFDQTVTNIEDELTNFDSNLPPILTVEISSKVDGLYPRDLISTFTAQVRNIGDIPAEEVEYQFELDEGAGRDIGTIASLGPGEVVEIHEELQPLLAGQETCYIKLYLDDSDYERSRISMQVTAEARFVHISDITVRELIDMIDSTESISGEAEAEIIAYLKLARIQLATASAIILAKVGTIDLVPDFEFELNTITNLLLLAAEVNIGVSRANYMDYYRSNNIPSDIREEISFLYEKSLRQITKAKQAGIDEDPSTTQIINRYKDDVEKIEQAEDDAKKITTDPALSREAEINSLIKEFDITSHNAKGERVYLKDYRFSEDDWGIGYDIEK